MRQHDRGRHRLSAAPARSYVIAFLAVLAVLFAGLGLSGTFASAATASPVAAMADRGLESPVSEVSTAQMKASITQAVTQARAAIAAHAAAVLAAHTYTVRKGDSIGSVALRQCHGQARYWTGIYAASRAHRWTNVNANVLTAGQRLYLDCAWVPQSLRFAPAPRPVIHRPVITTSSYRGASSYRASSYRAPATVSTAGLGSYQSCVITRESGGRSQVMNSSGHYGLYQFDAQTWASGGGNPADFGHAGVTEQNRVFAAVYAARGTQPWSPSDHC